MQWAVQSPGHVEELKCHRMHQWFQVEGVGAITMLCTRDDVKPAREEDFRTGYTGAHRSNAPVQYQEG